MWQRIREEPAMFLGMIQTVLALGLSFGMKLNAEQVGAILACSAAILSFWTRQYVTPTSNPKLNGRPLVRQKV